MSQLSSSEWRELNALKAKSTNPHLMSAKDKKRLETLAAKLYLGT